MGGTSKPINAQVGEHARAAPSSRDSLETTLDWLIKSGPRWARVPAVLLTVAVTLSSPIAVMRHWLFPPDKPDPTLSAKDPAASQLDMTSVAKTSIDYAAINTVINRPDATDDERSKAKAALATTMHRFNHLSNVKDAVPWVIFGKRSPNDYFGYKFFQSDKCLLISRVENGQGTAEWLSDPNQPVASASAAAAALPAVRESARPDEVRVLEAAWGEGRKIDVQGLSSDSLLNSPGVEKSPVQSGCVNPHPGVPVVAVGPAINSCQTPTFRKWADGCSQVQIYDQCTRVWGPVVWQACSKVHHG